MTKPFKPETWRTGVGDPVDEYKKTLQKMKMTLLNTPPERIKEFNMRFDAELKALEALIEIDDSYEIESIIDHEKHWSRKES